MLEVTFRFARLLVIVDLETDTATIIPKARPYSQGQPLRLSLDELVSVLQQSKASRKRETP